MKKDGHKMAKIARLWARGTRWGLRFICNITMEIRGTEHIQPDTRYILASKHQSAFETVMYYLVFPYPIFVLKKEIVDIPLFGRYTQNMGMIAVDREGGASALKDLIKKSKDALDKGHPIVLFPEGTRTMVGEKSQYQAGIAALHSNKSINAEILPAALNSGVHWPISKASSKLMKPGNIVIQILPPIKQGEFSKAEFIPELKKRIETATSALVEESAQSAISTARGESD